MNDVKDKRKVNLILLGDSGVGKTSLINRYVNEEFRYYCAVTLIFDGFCKLIDFDDKTIINLQIWDTVGIERFPKSVAVQYYRKADCCMLVYSVNDPHSFNSIEYWKKELLIHKGLEEFDKEFPFILCGNKVDTTIKMNCEPAIKLITSEFEYEYFRTSAKEGTNVNDAFETIAKMGYQYIFYNASDEKGSKIDLMEISTENTKSWNCYC